MAWSLGVSVLPVGALIKLIPIKYFAWTSALNVEDDVDDNKVLQLHSMFNEKMGTLQNEYLAHLQTKDEDDFSVDSQQEEENDDEDPGQINGQDDGGTSDDDDDTAEMSGGPGKGPRSSNVNRYSMRLTQMVEKKKKKKN